MNASQQRNIAAALGGIGILQTGADQGTTLGTAIGAAASGAAIGASFGGPAGAGIGAIAGLGLNLIGSLFHHSSKPPSPIVPPDVQNGPGGFSTLDLLAIQYNLTHAAPLIVHVHNNIDGREIIQRHVIDKMRLGSSVNLTGLTDRHSPSH